MNIIIEGPDATGKTTLANKLKEKYGFETMHLTSKTPNDLKFHMDLLEKDNMVYDRFMCGEMVYPEIYNRPPKLTIEEVCAIMQRIVDNNDILIIMFASDIETLKKRLIERGELDYLKEIEQQNHWNASAAARVDQAVAAMRNASPELTEWDDCLIRQLVDISPILREKVCRLGGLFLGEGHGAI